MLHVDVAESVVTQSGEDVSCPGVSTTDCLETGNTGGHREKNKVKTKPNKNKIKAFQKVKGDQNFASIFLFYKKLDYLGVFIFQPIFMH